MISFCFKEKEKRQDFFLFRLDQVVELRIVVRLNLVEHPRQALKVVGGELRARNGHVVRQLL